MLASALSHVCRRFAAAAGNLRSGPLAPAIAALIVVAGSTPTQATDYFWQTPASGPFATPPFWMPFTAIPPMLGPGGPGDTVNFDLGLPPLARHTVSDVSGQNDRLLVHNDSVTLDLSGDYTLLSASSVDPGFTVGVADGDSGDVTLTGTGILQTEFSSIGHVAGSSGVVTLDDTGLTWNNSEDLMVGNGGAGALTILAGEVAVGGSLLANDQSSIQLDGGKLTVNQFGAGAAEALDWQRGTLRLTSNSPLTMGAGGLFGASLLIDQDKALEINGSPSIAGGAMLEVGTGGSVSNGGGAGPALIGYGGDAGTTGVVTVTGADSSWTNGSNLHVGLNAHGALSIEAGGHVSNSQSSIASNFLGSSGAEGSVTVTGAGSTWTNSNFLRVGVAGTGTLTIADGGHVSSAGGSIGFGAESTGMVNVSGANSTWAHVGDLDIGSLGSGKLTIDAGGSVSSGTAIIGNSIGSIGAVTVSGAGSAWTIPPRQQDNTNELYIGQQGSGMLTIGAGGQVTVGGGNGTVTLAASGDAGGVLHIGAPAGEAPVAPGMLNAAEVVGGAGTGGAKFVFNHTSSAYFFTPNGLPNTTGILISGDTSVEHLGPGSTVLTRDNTYTGGTTIADGTLLLRDFGWITGDVENDGTLAFQHANSRIFDGSISGTGRVIQAGGNTTITLSGANSYTGGTTVLNGTLRTVVSGAFPNNTAYRVDDGALDLQNSFLLTMSSLSGDGGALQLGGTSLTVDQTSDTSFAGDITGGGTLTKTGAGTLTLAGTSSHTGDTTVGGGTLNVEGAITNSTITVGAGGTLGGSGSVASVVVNGGAIAPGGSAGTLSVNGLLALDADSMLDFELDGLADVNDKIAVTGDLALAGTLNVENLGGFEAGAYTLLTYTGSLSDNGLALGALPNGFDVVIDVATPGRVRLQVTAAVAGDYNQNGVVDLADYTVWRDTLGSTTQLAADGDGDEQIGSGDYMVWRTHFGQSTSVGADPIRSPPIPEPAGCTLLCLGLAGVWVTSPLYRKVFNS